MQEKRGAFLDLLEQAGFSPGHIGAMVNWFLNPAREEGITDPKALCRRAYESVYEKWQRNESSNWPDHIEAGERMATFLYIMHDNPQEAYGMAEWAIWWANLNHSQRDALRAPQQEEYRQQWMESQAATDKQVAYLKSLGCEVTQPISRADASRLIDEAKRRKGKRPA